jgi:hypothetical protein
MKKIFFLLLICFSLFQGCKKSISTPEYYYIKFNIGNTSYLITDTLNVLYAQNLGPYSTRPTVGGDAKLMFAISAPVENGSTKDSADNGYYTLITADCLVGFNLTKDSTVLGTYANDSSSLQKRSGIPGYLDIYSKTDQNKGHWQTTLTHPFTITITENNSKYIAGNFSGSLLRNSIVQVSDSIITITNGTFKVAYQ